MSVIAGTLEKRGRWNPAWKSRFFVLTDMGDLKYFRNTDEVMSGSPLGVISVSRLEAIPGCATEVLESGIEGERHIIEIHVSQNKGTTKKGYILAAPSAAVREKWICHLRMAVASSSGLGTGLGGSRESSESDSEEQAIEEVHNIPTVSSQEGSLDKRGFWNREWRSRHFILDESGVLAYYASERDARTGASPCGRIPIAPERVATLVQAATAAASAGNPAAFLFCGGGSSVVARVEEGGVEDGRWVFRVDVPGRCYVLGAASEDARREWMLLLRRAAAGGGAKSTSSVMSVK